jgi:hypothetical protein
MTSEKFIQKIKVYIHFCQAAYQTQFFGVSGGNFGHILGEDAVQFGSRLFFGAHVRNVTAIKDHLGNGADRGNAGAFNKRAMRALDILIIDPTPGCPDPSIMMKSHLFPVRRTHA